MNRVTIALFSLFTAIAGAQPVYKSVDEGGNVTYSSTPPADAKHIEDTGIVSQPSDPDASADDAERIKQTASELERDRKARESERAKQKAATEAAAEKEKTPAEQPIIRRHRPIIQQPTTPPTGGVPKPLPRPTPPVAAPSGGTGGN